MDYKTLYEQQLEENKKIKEEKRQTQQFWTCLMDYLDNPDNPDAEYVNEWCESNSISDVDKKALLEAFALKDEEHTEEGTPPEPKDDLTRLQEENKKLKEENDTLFHKADNWELKYHTLRYQLNLSSDDEEQ